MKGLIMLRFDIHKLTRFIVCMFALGMSVACFAQSKQTSPSIKLDDYFTKFESHGFSGSVLVVRDDIIQLKKGYGFSDHNKGIPVTVKTAFSIGSLTKQFTASAILRLEEAGLLSVSDSISHYLDFIPEDKSQVTIHQLLNHTSGIESDYWDGNPELSEQEYLAMVLSKELINVPGEKYRYSNIGYHLLKEIIENVAQEDYENYLKNTFFDPLGMENTGFSLVQWSDEQLAHYQDWTTKVWEADVEIPTQRPVYFHPEGSAGLLSTVDDLYLWHQALMGGKVLQESSLKKMFTPYQNYYGYAWNISTTIRGTTLHYHGGTDYDMGTTAGFYHYPDDNTMVVFLSNTNLSRTVTHEYLMNQIEGILFDGEVAMPPASTSRLSKENHPMTGTYLLPSGDSLKVVERHGHIRVIAEDENGTMILRFPESGVTPNPSEYENLFDSIFSAIDTGNFEPLRSALWTEVNFDSYSKRIVAAWSYYKQSFGEFKGARIVHQRSFVFQDRPEEWSFVLFEFENGKAIIRAMNDQEGKVYFRRVHILEHFEITLGYFSGTEFTSWDCFLAGSSKFEFKTGQQGEPDLLEITSGKAKLVAKLIEK